MFKSLAHMARILSRSTRQASGPALVIGQRVYGPGNQMSQGHHLFKPNNLYSSRCILQPEHHVVPVRFYAKESASKDYNETMKGVSLRVKDKLETIVWVLQRKMEYYAYLIAPEEGYRIGYFKSMRMKSIVFQALHKNYDPSKPDFEMKVMDEVEKFNNKIEKLLGEEIVDKLLRLNFTTKWQIKGIQDIRTLILTLIDIWVEDWARPEVEVMLMDAVDKVEEKIKKPLTLNNKKGYDLLREECIKIGAPRFRSEMVKEDGRKYLEYMFFTDGFK